MRALVLCLLGTVALGTVRLDRHAWSAAIEARSRHFVVETNTFPEIARSLGTTLDRAYTLFQDRFGPLHGPARRPMRVVLFRNRGQYLRFGDGVEGAIGHFDAKLDRCALVWNGGIGAAGWPIAVHEACHNYFRRRHQGLSLPSWYSEGIACYFEGLQDQTSTRGASRVRIATAKRSLERGHADLALVLTTKAHVHEGRLELNHFRPARFYSLAWSLVHFLATDERYRDGFRRFELRLFASRPRRGRRETVARFLLEDECGSLELLEQRWRAHLRRLPTPKKLKAPPVYAWEFRAASPFVRYAALRRLPGHRVTAALREGIVECLDDDDLIVRIAAARAIAPRMDADAVRPMTLALDLGDPELKRVALKALAHPGAGEAVPRLLREREDVEDALMALATIRHPSSYRTLREALLDRSHASRVRARCAAALRDDPAAGAVLKVAVHDTEPSVRNAARAALIAREARKAPRSEPRKKQQPPARRLDEAKQIAVLRDSTASDTGRIRACRLLGGAGAVAAVPALRRLCRPHVADRVRLEAVRALVRITGETRGFAHGQSARARETAFRAWASGSE